MVVVDENKRNVMVVEENNRNVVMVEVVVKQYRSGDGGGGGGGGGRGKAIEMRRSKNNGRKKLKNFFVV